MLFELTRHDVRSVLNVKKHEDQRERIYCIPTVEDTVAMSFSIQAPDPFNFNCPEQWPNWIRRFERYCLASKLSDEDEKN